jgi:hypothetical protein
MQEALQAVHNFAEAAVIGAFQLDTPAAEEKDKQG